MSHRLAAFALLGGCSFSHGAIDNGTTDAAVTADVASDSGSVCMGSGIVKVCLFVPSAPYHVATNATIDTDSTTACLGTQPGTTIDACVVGGSSVALDSGATLTAHGTRPLVIVSGSTFTVAGTLDLSSHRGVNVGANGDSSACAMGMAPTFNNSGGGGYGGSFGGKGGTGGTGENGLGGIAADPITAVTALRGGCAGGRGAGGGGANGGPGGGAVYLLAATSLAVSGTINASGAGGGGGGGGDSGGGGGGSGGMIGLEAPSVMLVTGAKIFANGGGGGEGFETTQGKPGDDAIAPTPAAAGGKGGTPNGGDGGDGSQASAGANGKNGNSSGGGGGGGGGAAGVIVLVPTQTVPSGVAVMPPPS